MSKKKRLLRDRRKPECPQWVKDWVDGLIAEGKLGEPTKFVRENPDGSPCFELETEIVAAKSLRFSEAMRHFYSKAFLEMFKKDSLGTILLRRKSCPK